MIDAHQGYQSARTGTASPRGAERETLRRLAGEIETAGDDYKALAMALQKNTELWTTLAVDLAGDGNGLPTELRASLLSLANFVGSRSRAVLMGDASADVLCEINRNVAEGLARPSLAEAA